MKQLADRRYRAYGSEFYKQHEAKTVYAARTILSIVFEIVRPRRVVDVGCGTGTWLTVARSLGVDDLLGIEGEWAVGYIQQLGISVVAADLEKPFRLNRKFDLAICLEVAEHLRPERAASFIDDLCHAADVVLFSAAIPRQGGTHHQNEQWQSYWAELFAEKGYEPYDCIRPRIWGDEQIPFWYRQNTILYARKGNLLASYKPIKRQQFSFLDMVHPELFKIRPTQPGLRSSLRIAGRIPLLVVDRLYRMIRQR